MSNTKLVQYLLGACFFTVVMYIIRQCQGKFCYLGLPNYVLGNSGFYSVYM